MQCIYNVAASQIMKYTQHNRTPAEYVLYRALSGVMLHVILSHIKTILHVRATTSYYCSILTCL